MHHTDSPKQKINTLSVFSPKNHIIKMPHALSIAIGYRYIILYCISLSQTQEKELPCSFQQTFITA